MIKQSKISSVKKGFGKFIFSILVFSFTQGLQAQSVEKLDSAETTANIKYLGISNGMFLFDVRYNNPQGGKYMLEITESSNNNLFREIGRDRLLVKRFRIPTDLGELKFIIRNLKDNSSQSFLVNRNQRVYEDVVVKKIN